MFKLSSAGSQLQEIIRVLARNSNHTVFPYFWEIYPIFGYGKLDATTAAPNF